MGTVSGRESQRNGSLTRRARRWLEARPESCMHGRPRRRPRPRPMPTLPRYLPIALAATAACFPAVTHGPRVESGLSVGATGAVTYGPTHVEGDEGGINLREGVVGPYVGYGWAPTSPNRAGAYIGLAVPLLFTLRQGDL